MKIEKVGLMTPGDMGQAVAMQIKARGFTVCTALDKRSERSRALAREAGLTDLGTIARLVAECDVVLSVMNPGAALDFAREAANALRASGRHTLIVDCNAIAPDTVHEIAGMVEQAGGRFLDGGIIGPPPRGKAKTNLYVSGPGAADLEPLGGPQLNRARRQRAHRGRERPQDVLRRAQQGHAGAMAGGADGGAAAGCR